MSGIVVARMCLLLVKYGDVRFRSEGWAAMPVGIVHVQDWTETVLVNSDWLQSKGDRGDGSPIILRLHVSRLPRAALGNPIIRAADASCPAPFTAAVPSIFKHSPHDIHDQAPPAPVSSRPPPTTVFTPPLEQRALRSPACDRLRSTPHSRSRRVRNAPRLSLPTTHPRDATTTMSGAGQAHPVFNQHAQAAHHNVSRPPSAARPAASR